MDRVLATQFTRATTWLGDTGTGDVTGSPHASAMPTSTAFWMNRETVAPRTFLMTLDKRTPWPTRRK
jgi:hypothetical protein